MAAGWERRSREAWFLTQIALHSLDEWTTDIDSGYISQ
jgi:hypothetical protein